MKVFTEDWADRVLRNICQIEGISPPPENIMPDTMALDDWFGSGLEEWVHSLKPEQRERLNSWLKKIVEIIPVL